MQKRVQIFKNYLQALERGDYQGIVALFEQDGLVNSPLYGSRQAPDFYKELLRDTSTSKIVMLNTFVSTDDSTVGAVHFRYNWELKGGLATSFECVDVFYFGATGKIKEMTIIYDTFPSRQDIKK